MILRHIPSYSAIRWNTLLIKNKLAIATVSYNNYDIILYRVSPCIQIHGVSIFIYKYRLHSVFYKRLAKPFLYSFILCTEHEKFIDDCVDRVAPCEIK